jgi:hypothetical protein
MAVYKVIQDVESEDKLIGPLTLKGLIYAAITFLTAFINFKLLYLGTPIKWPLIFGLAIPMVLFAVLASPLGREQPTEVWLLARLRFYFKPRRRMWDEEGKNDLVTITAPKKIDRHIGKDLSQSEVHSRLKTLALTLDTRGWAVKNVDVNLNVPEAGASIVTPQSDRLVKGGNMPSQMPVVDVHAADDIMDEKHNPTAQKFDAMMQKAEVERKHSILSRLMDLVDGDEPKKSTKDLPATRAALSKIKKSNAKALSEKRTKEAEEMFKKLAKARADFANEHAHPKKKHTVNKTVMEQPVQGPPPTLPAASAPAQNNTVTAARQTVNMELAQSGSAFSVATLSQLANRQPRVEQTGPNEVTISLH